MSSTEVLEKGKFCPHCGKSVSEKASVCPECGVTVTEEDAVFCYHCGNSVDIRSAICPKCGISIKRKLEKDIKTSSGEKNAGLAAVLSFFFPGLGQIYNGQIGKGLVFMVAAGISVLLMLIAVGFILYPLVWVYGLYDAYNTATKINLGEIHV